MPQEFLPSQEELEVLRESELCRDLPYEVLSAVLLQTTTNRYRAGEVIFEQADPGDYMLIIKSGVIEICTKASQGMNVLAYSGRGECVGELALLTGAKRSATARVPEMAEAMILSKTVFEDLIMNFPVFLRQLCVILARRLEQTIHRMPTPSATPKQLQGNLRFFDLSIVLQTLMDSKQTGQMAIAMKTASGRGKGQLFFNDGSITWAHLGHLRGEEAVYQLFQLEMDGTFNFVGNTVDVAHPVPNVSLPPMSLLLEAARLQDELGEHRRHLTDTSRRYRRLTSDPHWNDPDLESVVTAIWSKLDQPASLQDLRNTVPFCDAKVYAGLWELVKSSAVE